MRVGQRRAGREPFGGVAGESRHPGFLLDTLGQDLRFAGRQITRWPGFALLVVATLAVGIGANVAIFSVLEGVVFRPLPYAEPERLLAVWETPPEERWYQPFSAPDYLDVREQSRTLEEIGVLRDRWFNVAGGGDPERIRGAGCTASLLRLLGVPPERGRLFHEGEEVEGRDRVVLLSHGLWQGRFGGREDVVGQPITVDGESHVVVGVMPAHFEFPTPWGGRDDSRIWAPLVLPRDDASRSNHSYGAVARLADGVTREQAEAELAGIAARLAEAHPDTNARVRIWAEPMMERTLGGVRDGLLILTGVVGFVLLIACANVASMLLARTAQRGPELAVRASLGAPRGRLVRQLLTESLALSLLGGVAGVLVARWGVGALTAILPANVPRVSGIQVDLPVLAFAVALTVVTGLLFGLAPAVTASRSDLVTALGDRPGRGGGRARNRSLGLLVAAQFALGFVLVNGAAVLLASYDKVLSQHMNFDADRTLVAGVSLSGPAYEEPHDRRAFWLGLVERIRSLPGVEAAGVTTKLPLRGGSNGNVLVDDQVFDPLVERELVEFSFVDDGYHRAMGIPLVAGRLLDRHDLEAAAVAAGQDVSPVELPVVINRRMAERLWSVEDALGRIVRPDSAEEGFRARVVGIVADVRQWGAERPPLSEMYFPHTSEVWGPIRGKLVVRAAGDPLALVPAVRAAVAEGDDQIPMAEPATMADVVYRSTGRRRFSMLLVGLFALTALVLIVAGTYGVMSYAVSQRTHEIGVRMALGAHRREVAGLFLARAARQVLPGLAVGLAGALVASTVTRGMVYEISALSPLYLASAAAVMVPVALVASLVPVLRATRVDPTRALRSD